MLPCLKAPSLPESFQHRGRVVDARGDNLLAEFASVVGAVKCAVAMQKEIQTHRGRPAP